ncbi:MAG: periplasmic heavy metal sensor [Chlorobiaceae bacterium]|nr:periplasmic heavy metal sensor [Chlorobiaceae bacterium]
MDFLSSKRFVTVALMALVMLNITLLGVIWWQSIATKSYRSVEVTQYYSRNGSMAPELSLDEKQKTAFLKLRQEHFRKSKPEIQKIILLKKELIHEAVKPNPDKAKLEAIADSIGQRQTKIETDLATHFHELSELCTPAQRDSLGAFLGKIYTVRYQRSSTWRGGPPEGHQPGMRHPGPPPPFPQR